MRFPGVKLLLSFAFLCFSFGNATLFAKDKVPAYKGHINDFAGKLSSAEIAQIEAKLKAYEDSTSVQIAVVIEGALNGNTPFDRAIEFAEGWGVGDNDEDNGVLLYLAINDTIEQRGYFTVTSQATQGRLTDGIVGQIQRDYLVPNMRTGQFALAIDQTVTAYMQALDGEFKGKETKDKVPGWVFFLVVFGIITLITIINNSKPGRGYRSGGMYWFPTGGWGGNSGGWGGGSSGGGWGGFGGGGGFDGGGAGGNW